MPTQQTIEQLASSMREATQPQRIQRGADATHHVLTLLAVMGIPPSEQIGVLAFALGAFIHQQQVDAAAGAECMQIAHDLLDSAYATCVSVGDTLS